MAIRLADQDFPLPEVLPAEPTNGGGSPPPPTSLIRLRQAASLAPFLRQHDLDIRATGDGRVTVTLPAAMLEVFIQDLGQRLEAWQTAMRRARIQEAERRAELHAATGEAQRQLARQEEKWALEYEKLRARGLAHRSAIHRVAGYNGRQGKGGEHIPLDAVEWGVRRGRARLQRRGELPPRPHGTRAQVAARRREIVRLAQEEGLSRREIADKLHISYALVLDTLKQAGVPMPDRRRRAGSGD